MPLVKQLREGRPQGFDSVPDLLLLGESPDQRLILLSKSGDAAVWTLDEMPAERGFQLRLPTFPVPSGHEEQSCYFVRVPDLAGGQDVWIER